MKAVVARHLVVNGTVQGVGFRAATLREATRIAGLSGWVRNLPDGAVEILVQGEQAKVDELVEWSNSGPPSARVTKVDVQPAKADPNLGAFSIKR
ncbi:MAG: acylphosphatase [Deltaproteobacteria bacterium]|nr:acylphosphatase [Deltaproteobacteria bacterium]